ncbi:putative multi-sensor hybrid histidine kinase [Mycobacterium xenopi 4042]|uniref:Putative multi-sensor hybrid histidine kinase n=1 Tax=Mycobacterium xenopi 4042 TaxID=1299334 RepID=X8ADY2_MYCXE|nr:putative multi-sensor hybrid histidine kinase [Mycobacterium xenopi 4042]
MRQFETARNTSLTLQRAMLPSMQPPAGFAVRYEPAVPPLEIGGDWYDVLSLGEAESASWWVTAWAAACPPPR